MEAKRLNSTTDATINKLYDHQTASGRKIGGKALRGWGMPVSGYRCETGSEGGRGEWSGGEALNMDGAHAALHLF